MDSKKTYIYVIIIAVLANFLAAYTSNTVVMALPQIAYELNLSNIMQNWIVTIYLITIAVLSVPLGKIASKKGFKRSFIFGSIIFFLGAIGTVLASDIPTLFFFRIFQAIGASFTFVCALSMIVSAVPPNKRGAAIGINIASGHIGISLAPVLGGFLTYNFGWRSIFIITFPISILIILFTIFKVKDEWTLGEDDKIDIIGGIVYALGITTFIYGFTTLNQLKGLIFTTIGIIILLLFIIFEIKSETPIFDISLYKNKIFTLSNIAYLFSYIGVFAVTTIMNYHFQYIRSWNPDITGLILLATPLTQSIITPYSGRLSDRVNPQKLCSFGMFIVTISLIILVSVNGKTDLWIIVFALAMEGLGYGLFLSPNTNSIMSSIPRENTGMGSAAVTTIRMIGQTLSIGLLSLVFAIVMGNVLISPKVYPELAKSCQITLIIGVVLTIISLIASLISMKINNKNSLKLSLN